MSTVGSIAELAPTFTGQLLQPADAAYNYMDHDEAGDPAAAAYGPNYPRLRDLKARYDPDNFFHTNVNIRPR